MSEPIPAAWYEANQRYLSRAIAQVRVAIERFVRGEKETGRLEPSDQGNQEMPSLPALATLCSAFELSSFERKILLMCAGAEMDSRFAELFASSAPGAHALQPTFSLALAAFADAHWSALSPGRPLRYWRLVDLRLADALTTSPLRIDERVLHYLVGVEALDERLLGSVRPAPAAENVSPSHLAVAERIAGLWRRVRVGARLPIVELCGEELAAKRAIAAAASAMVGLRLHALPAWKVAHATGAELDTILRLWEREAVLGSSALLLEHDDADNSDAPANAIAHLTELIRSPMIVSTRSPRRAGGRPAILFDIAKPTVTEQAEIWRTALEPFLPNPNGLVDALVSQFSLDSARIHSAAQQAAEKQGSSTDASTELSTMLWDACRRQARPRIESLAQRIDPAASWDDLVLPEKQKELLRHVGMHVRQRKKVYHEWGFASLGARGLGISALFAGPSGTGKTMAAEALANELRLDLYRIDLSQVVSKYIGETEKNLRRVFDAADEGAAILLFDEADALFGKRTDVKDSHDRYANIEVSYLLQRMEAYRGLAILTTNRKSALDQAFLRRIRFVVEFPFPEAPQRAEIWRRVFPRLTPTEDLRIDRLARLNAAGGNIKNIALGAAFLAADSGQPVGMAHVLTATRHEFAKLEKPLSDAEIAGWV
jgi:ATP-dependent 26S proteasome regulatory subunit